MTDVSSILTSTTAGAASKQVNNGLNTLANNFQQFLSLLTTQLKNQDPLSPMDTNQFTQQIVQMTSVQQQLLSNNLLTTLVSQGLSTSVNYIGKTVTASAPTQTLTAGQANWTYNLPATATSANITINDSNNNLVWSGSAPSLTQGSHSFSWNGKDLKGVQLPDGGTYTMVVSAKNQSGAALASQITTTGVVSGVTQQNGTAYLTVGGSQVPMSAVLSIQSGTTSTASAAGSGAGTTSGSSTTTSTSTSGR